MWSEQEALSSEGLQIIELIDTNCQEDDGSDTPAELCRKIPTLSNNALDCSEESLVGVPEEIFSYSMALKTLYLQSNQLESLPGGFFDKLPCLEYCDLRWNRLRTLPDFLGEHQKLSVLLLQENELSHLPLTLGFCAPHLRALNLRGNPLVDPPNYILEEGVEAIRSYLTACHRREASLERKDSGYSEREDLCSPSEETAFDEYGDAIYGDLQADSYRHKLATVQLDEGPNLTAALYRKLSCHEASPALLSSCSDIWLPRRVKSKKKASRWTIAQEKLKKKAATDLVYSYGVWRDVPFEGLSGDDLAVKSLESLRQQVLRNTAYQRERMVQRLKDKEALKDWRQETAKLQRVARPNLVKNDPPFGTELSFDEAHLNPNSQFTYLPPRDFEKEVNSCLQRLENFASDPPMSKANSKAALQRLQEVEEIQRRLNLLKIKM